MIKKENSLKIMESLNKAIDDISKMNETLEDINDKINTKISIINTCNAYSSSLAQNLMLVNNGKRNERIIFNYEKNKIKGGNYESFGQVVHSKFVSMPTNIFNFLTEIGPIFKDNATVEFYKNESEKDYKYSYSNILKYETDQSKEDVFKIFSENKFTMAVQINIGNITGGTKFNMIEFAPYLPGSFNINQIRIYTVDQYLKQDMILPERILSDKIENVGMTRISLDNVYQLYRIEFDIEVTYQDNGYPFGLKHLYFYNYASDTESDHIALEVDMEDYIDYVGEGIKIITTNGTVETTASKYGIEYYLFYDKGVFQTKLTNPIARNITKFYAKIPLTQPLVGIEFTEILVR